ncbi:MAG TPA: hypothetical protein VF221_09225 [Chloroflexota bacterium]
MNCPHCHTVNLTDLPFSRSLEGGRAFAQTCAACGHILNVRSRLEGDPPAAPLDFNSMQLARLTFVRWRLAQEAEAQVHGEHYSPPTAA